MTHLSFQSQLIASQLGSKNNRPSTESNYFSFDALLKQYPNIPEATAILGKTGSLPILFDLDDPRPGSILLVNDHLPSIRKFQTVMMRSIIAFSHPTNFQFVIISHYPEKWMDLVKEFDPEFLYCAGISGEFENSAEDWILFLTKRAEERSTRKSNGPAVILFIDDYETIQNLDLHVRINLDWLIKKGSTSRIWTVVGLDINKNPEGVKKISQFRTKIFGQIQDKVVSQLQEFIPGGEIKKLNSDQNFVTKIGSNWVHFWAPILQGK